MPSRPQTPCNHPGCPALVRGRFCPTHTREDRRATDERRGSASSRGYDARWRKARAAYLRAHPVCECSECAGLGRVRPATVVDHITPHKGDAALFWNPSNWRAMAASCHNRKTARADGGFGRKIQE